MTDEPDRLPQRDPGTHRPEHYVVFPTPWPIPPSEVPGWFCPSDEWPPEQQEVLGGCPGDDPDIAGSHEFAEKDARR